MYFPPIHHVAIIIIIIIIITKGNDGKIFPSTTWRGEITALLILYRGARSKNQP
jgi:hypothetical protein